IGGKPRSGSGSSVLRYLAATARFQPEISDGDEQAGEQQQAEVEGGNHFRGSVSGPRTLHRRAQPRRGVQSFPFLGAGYADRRAPIAPDLDAVPPNLLRPEPPTPMARIEWIPGHRNRIDRSTWTGHAHLLQLIHGRGRAVGELDRGGAIYPGHPVSLN